MDWKKTIISALKGKNLSLALRIAAKVDPEELFSFLNGFLEDKNYRPYTAMFLNELGISYCNTKKFSEAERAFKKASKNYRNLADQNPEVYTPHVDATLMNLGNLYKNRGNLFQAEKAYKEALKIRRDLAKENPAIYMSYVAVTLDNLGGIYSDTQRFSEAEKAYKEALKIRRILARENPAIYMSHVAVTLNNLGILYNSTQRYYKAEKTYEKALKIRRFLEKENPGAHIPDIAVILNNLGALYSDTQRFLEAEKAYKETLQKYRILAEESPDVYISDVALTLNSFGALYSHTQRFSEAEKAYREALKEYRKLAEENPGVYTHYVTMVLNNLGVLYSKTQSFFEAEKVYKEALKIRRILARENPAIYIPHVAATLNNLGTLYKDTRKFFQAEKAYKEALQKYRALAKENSDVYTPHVAANLDSLGTLYTITHKFSEAEKAYIEALEIRRTLADQNPEAHTPNVALTLNNAGNLYISTQKYFEAEKAYKEALQTYRALAKENPEAHTPNVAMALNNLGNLYSDTQKYFEAEKAYKEALEIRRTLAKENPDVHTPDVASVLNNLGNLYKDMQRFSEAEKAYNGAIRKYKEAVSWFDTAKSAYNLSTVTFDEKTMDDSRKLLEMAILFTGEERYTYAQKGRYENIYLTLLDRDITTFGVLEALRDPGLLSLSWDHVLSQREIEKAEKNVEFQKTLAENTLNRQLTCREFTIKLSENMIFIYIQEMMHSPFFFTVGSDGVNRFNCKKEFFTIGRKLLVNLRIQQGAARKTDDLAFLIEKFDRLCEQWYQTLPEEIKDLLQEKDCIVVSPDPTCSYFPLEALPVEGQPLCMGKTVVRAASLHQFLMLSKRNLRFDSSFIMGNPWPKCSEKKLMYVLPSSSKRFRISFLNSAQEEAKTLTERLPNPILLSGHEATGEKFLSEVSRHSLIHFSGHGSMGRILFLSGPLKGFPPPFEPEEFSDLRKAERSSGTKRVNMMEEWHPITDLDLFDVKLTEGAVIFLNACETGQHKYAGGGYYQGLPAVFLKNGAHSVVSSLVPLFDEHSKEFALHFYENLFHTRSVTKALKEAREWIRDTYKAQVYWVPYIHYGSL